MIIQISRLRLMQFAIFFIFLIVFWLTIGFYVTVQVENSPEGEVIATLKFLAPMKPWATAAITFQRLNSGQDVPYRSQWITANTLKIIIDEKDFPRGHTYQYKIKSAPTMIWPVHVWRTGEFQSRVKLRFLGIPNSQTIPSKGPVLLQFNTMVTPKEVAKFIQFPVAGKFKPVKAVNPTGHSYADLSQWQFWPNQKLKNLAEYSITIHRGLPSLNGSKLDQTINESFATTSEFIIEEVHPHPGSQSIWLTREIVLNTNQNLKACSFEITGLPGSYTISKQQVKFKPYRILQPNKTYQVKVHLTSTSNEELEYQYSFTTTNLGNAYWLELKHSPNPCLWLMKGNQTQRKMNVSFKAGLTIPLGTLYEDKREMTKNNSNWFKLNADILLHSLPSHIKDNHKTLALPQTYSCIYVEEKDLRELSKLLPPRFMLISHP